MTIDRFNKKWQGCETGCHQWVARATLNGYGRFWFEGSNWMAHRVAWVLENGSIPDGMRVLHSCDNPACVNPAHLWLGTQADNVSDMDKKGRRAPCSGELNGNSKLTDGDVVIIRRDARATCRQLAKKWGVSKAQISRIRTGRSRKFST